MTHNYRFDRVRNSINGFDFINKHTKLRKIGPVYRGLCPFPHHKEKTPSFTFYPVGYMSNGKPQEYDSFYCFGCDCGGDLITFKKMIDELSSYTVACDILEKELGIINDDDSMCDYHVEKLSAIQNVPTKPISSGETNVICSLICYKYLEFVKEYCSDLYDEEQNKVEDLYGYVDENLLDLNEFEMHEFVRVFRKKISDMRKEIIKKSRCNND